MCSGGVPEKVKCPNSSLRNSMEFSIGLYNRKTVAMFCSKFPEIWKELNR